MRGSRGSLKSGISKPVRSLYAVSEVHATNGMEQSAYIGMYAACILALGIACVNATALVNSWSTFAHLVRRLIG